MEHLLMKVGNIFYPYSDFVRKFFDRRKIVSSYAIACMILKISMGNSL